MPETPSFVALYAGNTISTARILAASADADLVQYVSRLLQTSPPHHPTTPVNSNEGITLRLIITEENSTPYDLDTDCPLFLP